MAADADNGIGVEGVAPLATVLVVRVLDENGSGSSQDVADGIDYARTHGANVVNLSLSAGVPGTGGTWPSRATSPWSATRHIARAVRAMTSSSP